MPFRKKSKKELIDAAMPPSTTRKFLRKFYDYGRKKGWFPELPKDIKEGELGKWMRKNKKISDKELIEHMREFVHEYGSTAIELIFGSYGIQLSPRKTLSGFLCKHYADCLAMSAALGEMAREMGFDVKYHVVEGIDGHAYVVIDGKQHDPAFDKSYTHHKGKPQTREELAAYIWTNHGNFLREIGKLEKALTAHDIALKINPNLADAWNNKANTLSEMGRYEEALKHYDKALKINPNLAEAWNNKANTLSETGKYEEAIRHYDKALKINPHLAQAWVNKAIAFSEMNKYEEAVKTIKEALNKIPSNHPLRGELEFLALAFSSKLKVKLMK